MMLKSWSIFLVFISIMEEISCHGIENGNKYEECLNNSVVLDTRLDDCSLCACVTVNSRLLPTTRSSCVITEDVLERIMAQLFDAWRIITGTTLTRPTRVFSSFRQNNQNCSFSLEKLRSEKKYYSTHCDDLINEIESIIEELTEQIRLLVAWLDDPENFNPRIVILEKCLKCLNKKLDDTIAQYEQDIGDIKDKFGEMQQCLIDSINQRKEEICQLEILLEEKTYQLVTSNVNASNFVLAFSAFIKLNNDTFLDTLVEDVYGTGSSKVENILTFAYLLAKPEQRGQIYHKLVQFMQSNQHHLSMRILSVNKILKDDINRICNGLEPVYCTTLPAIYRDVLKLVDIFSNQVIKSLAVDICKKNHKSILLAGSSESEENLAGNALNEVLPDLLQRAYTNCTSKLYIISEFVRDLRWNKQKATGFTKLMSIVENPNDKLKVAFKLKQALENLRGPDGQEEEAKDALLRLKNQLPGRVSSLVWHTSCILTCYDNVSIYVGGTMSPDNFRVGAQLTLVDTSHWVYEPIGRTEGEYHFRIRNKSTGYYLGTHVPWKNLYFYETYGYTSARTEIDKEYSPRNFHWQVHFGNGSEYINLFHVGRKAYLMAFDGNAVLELREYPYITINWINICTNTPVCCANRDLIQHLGLIHTDIFVADKRLFVLASIFSAHLI